MPSQQTSANRARATLVRRSAMRLGKVQRATLKTATDWETLQRASFEPRSVSPVQVLALQRTAGNQAVSRLIQTKLSVGAAGDEYEQEADQVSEQVMRMPLAPAVQRVAEEEEVQTESMLQRSAAEPETGTVTNSTTPPITAAEKPARLHIHTDLDAPKLGLTELLQGAVGHSWVSLEWKDPATVPADMQAAHQPFLARGGKFADPMGFWPKMFHAYDPILDEWQSLPPGQRVGYSTNPFSSYVPGQMLHPDNMHTPKATQSYELTRDEAGNVIDYAESKRDAEYSVYFYNCTTFAKEAVEAAGKKPPSLSTLGICYPNALYEGIVKNQKAGVGTTEVDPLDGGAVTRVEGQEEAPKKK